MQKNDDSKKQSAINQSLGQKYIALRSRQEILWEKLILRVRRNQLRLSVTVITKR